MVSNSLVNRAIHAMLKDGMTVPQVATLLGMSERAVERRVARLRHESARVRDESAALRGCLVAAR